MSQIKYFDTHCHLQGAFYRANAAHDWAKAQLLGVTKVVLPGTTPNDSLRNISFAKEHSGVYAAAGLHPSEAKHELASAFLNEIDPQSIIAYGETGIDLYHQSNPPLALQLANFQAHIALALKFNKPLIIHARHADAEVYHELKKHRGLRIIMHCYTGTLEYAKKFIALGAFISLTGALTYHTAHNLRELATQLPLDHLLIETDAPFLTPEPFRNLRNAPEYVIFVAEQIAQLRGEALHDVAAALYHNALRAFNITD